MPMSTASLGRATEHHVRDDLERHGWRYIMRAAGSKGAADLLHGCPERGALLVQVGRGSKRLGPTERARLIEAASLVGAVPVLAVAAPRQPIVYTRVTLTRGEPWDPALEAL